MLYLSTVDLRKLLLAIALRNEAARRRRALAASIQQVKRRMAKRRAAAIARIVLMANQGAKDGPRRYVERATGKWRGSSISGYLRGGSDIDKSYVENFRMNLKTFDLLLALVGKTAFAAQTRTVAPPPKGKKLNPKDSMAYCRAHTDPPTTRFKLAVCLYAMAHGGPFKQIGDAASVSKNTVRAWMVDFCAAVMSVIKPIYMPRTPYSEAERSAVNGRFASRRGMPNVTLACDGSHIPFHPRGGKKAKMEYRNYKGWTSILSVAFIDSYYRFFDISVGYPGRAGDNTVLSKSKLVAMMQADPDKWLGPHGVVLGDCGASDGDSIFMNPYHQPTEPDKCWFNFCHSSTRFFVEETFGRWKNRWRFLLHPCEVDHKLTTQMIFASAILHNFCTVHPHSSEDLNLPADMPDAAWQRFFKENDAHMCPSCSARHARVCIHQAAYRNTKQVQAAVRKAPSQAREDARKLMWDMVEKGVSTAFDGRADEDAVRMEAQRIRDLMSGRAGAVQDPYLV